MTVRVQRGAPHVIAECENCDFHRDESGTSRADNARQAAKNHAASTGHTVYVQRCIGTYLNPPRTGTS